MHKGNFPERPPSGAFCKDVQRPMMTITQGTPPSHTDDDGRRNGDHRLSVSEVIFPFFVQFFERYTTFGTSFFCLQSGSNPTR